MTPRGLEEPFYAELDGLAGTATEPLTLFQEQYNDESANERTLDGAKNQYIDAPSVEAWLAGEPACWRERPSRRCTSSIARSRTGGTRTSTSRRNEPDPDTDYNFGGVRGHRKVTAWGGTPDNDEENPRGKFADTSRVWFYDLSSGPDGWQDGWNVDDPDVDGDGVADYRIPPAWHYARRVHASRLRGDRVALDRPGQDRAVRRGRPVVHDVTAVSPFFTENRIPNR